MLEEKSFDKMIFKADTRTLIDVTLLGICVTLFGLVSTIRPEVLSKDLYFTSQLVLAVPFFVCGLLARIKEVSYKDSYRWTRLTFISFTLAYGFFVNSLGLLLSFVAPIFISLIFFGTNTLLTLVRAWIVVSYKPSKLKSRLVREAIHIALIVFLGILPALKLY
jgi:hypothetical protein